MNAGKSSLINAIAKQPVSIVSKEAGTTTDVVKKTMEIHGIGPCVLLDTAGFDDAGQLGQMRIKAARKAALSTDIAVILFAGETDMKPELEWISFFRSSSTPVIAVLTQTDRRTSEEIKQLLESIRAGSSGQIRLIGGIFRRIFIQSLTEAFHIIKMPCNRLSRAADTLGKSMNTDGRVSLLYQHFQRILKNDLFCNCNFTCHGHRLNITVVI
jgi:small GTP-binding protein